jgi:hypothetical protein
MLQLVARSQIRIVLSDWRNYGNKKINQKIRYGI